MREECCSSRNPSYEVQFGDSLSEIAERHGTSAEKLLALNRLRSADEIHAGQILRVPMLSDPKPLGEGSAALLAAQRLTGEIDGDSVDLPRLIAALVEQEGHIDPGGVDSVQGRLDSDTCQAKDSDGSVGTPATVTEINAETPALLAEVQPDLAADPVDYGVASDGTIEVQIGETLGHYADWLHLSSEGIRKLNGLGKNTPLIVGRRMKLDFSAAGAPLFEKSRIAHHKSRQLEYFRRHRIKGVIEHPVNAGDNLCCWRRNTIGFRFGCCVSTTRMSTSTPSCHSEA